ncbi:hypothetical protein DAPPUDRAFT_264635 [Daphnia pulex]|uniref:Uncharacterized protein n=1 Tax=Daphnia pulex TaxID=6669 RepID=E9HS05_DAPPU|nr:hypothetical protein DAPPUDRAFT_264635 [Daphnia pulex]|eukprot:EFX65477.1 hypothetical protein DAPPUDRAFT_264635 [Daphnia pulex]
MGRARSFRNAVLSLAHSHKPHKRKFFKLIDSRRALPLPHRRVDAIVCPVVGPSIAQHRAQVFTNKHKK